MKNFFNKFIFTLFLMLFLLTSGCNIFEPDFDSVKPNVVRIISYYGDNDNEKVITGSGFIVNSEGYIVTNRHVVNSREEFGGRDGSKPVELQRFRVMVVMFEANKVSDARILAEDSKRDLALLKIDVEGALPFLPIAVPGTYRDGDSVWALGFPGAADSSLDAFKKIKITRGVVSAIIENDLKVHSIQTDASLNPGNSGGPLIDSHDRALGVNVMKVISRGVSQVAYSIDAVELIQFLNSNHCPYETRDAAPYQYAYIVLGIVALAGGRAIWIRSAENGPGGRWSGKRRASGKQSRPLTPAFPPTIAPDASTFRAHLVVLSGEKCGSSVLLGSSTIIGRDSEKSDLVFSSSKISRVHARVVPVPGRKFTVEDLGSTNGVWVNGKRINGKITLPANAEFSLAKGEVRLYVEFNL